MKQNNRSSKHWSNITVNKSLCRLQHSVEEVPGSECGLDREGKVMCSASELVLMLITRSSSPLFNYYQWAMQENIRKVKQQVYSKEK